MIEISSTLFLDEGELQFDYVRASGPGGQNVNKVSSAVQLRFDALNSPSLPAEVRARLLRLAGSRATAEGSVLIEAKRYRTQEHNRVDAVQRLVALIHKALEVPKVRRATRPTRAAQVRRVEGKKKRGEVKRMRGKVEDGE
jgi:ribosome-associated protein